MMNSIPYWWRHAPPTPGKQQNVQSNCDVVIVGAGLTGLSAAIVLARAGKSVQVFDRGIAGAGASTQNGGILSGNLRMGLTASMAAYGPDRGLAMYKEAIDARRAFRDFVNAEGIKCDLQYNGRFTGAMTPRDFDGMKRAADEENEALGVDAQILERQDQNAMVGSDLYHGGIGRDDIGSMHPAKFYAGLLAVAINAGVTVHDNTAVLNVLDQNHVETLRGNVTADRVIVAMNGYADNSDAWLRKRVVPVTSRIIATDEIDTDVMARLMPRMGTFGEARYLGRYYRPSPDGKRILLGGRDVLVGANPAGAARRLADNVVAIFPELRGIGVDTHWAGQVAYTQDELPSIFERDGIIYACGYCGSGTVWAPWFGRKAAYRILGDERARSAFDCNPPKTIPLYNGRPWFLPFAIGYYGVRDWIAGR